MITNPNRRAFDDLRSFTLPDNVDGEKVHAEFKDGVLNVRLPKAPTTKPKAVEVKVA